MLNQDQALAPSVAESGHNLLVCGQAGTGKTHTGKSMFRSLSRQRNVTLLCRTGMACLQYNEYNAKTVHRSIWTDSEVRLLLDLRLPKDTDFSKAKNHDTLWSTLTNRIINLCQKCGKTFKHHRSLKRHENRHKGRMPYHCCGKSFDDHTQFVRHRCSRHDKYKMHNCGSCGKSFATGHDVAKHVKQVHADKKVPCPTYGMLFASKYPMEQHEASHTGVMRHKCTCGKAYKYASGLSRHRVLCKK